MQGEGIYCSKAKNPPKSHLPSQYLSNEPKLLEWLDSEIFEHDAEGFVPILVGFLLGYPSVVRWVMEWSVDSASI